MRILSSATVALAVAGFFGFSSHAAKADLVYDLTIDRCSIACSTGGITPFGTVAISQSGPVAGVYTDTFTVQMNNPTYVFNGNGSGFDAFTFSLAAAGQTVTLSSAMTTAGFGVDGSLPQHMDGLGNFTYGITLTNAGTGATNLVFTVTDTTALNASTSFLP